MARRSEIDTTQEEAIFGLSFASLNMILLCFFVYLSSLASPNSIRETSVIETVRSYYGGPVETERGGSAPVSTAQIKSIAERAGFGVLEGAGRYTLTLPGGSLFASGDDAVRPEYVPVLRRIARIVDERDLQARIIGHTDDRPLQGGRFRDNWELSAARALSVLRIFTAAGVSEERVSAAGRAEFVPVAPNVTEEGRARNRRVTIVVEAWRGDDQP